MDTKYFLKAFAFATTFQHSCHSKYPSLASLSPEQKVADMSMTQLSELLQLSQDLKASDVTQYVRAPKQSQNRCEVK